jgi:hypothetical protein
MDLPPDMARRKPVLAYGSNAAVTQLKRKYPKLGETEVIPVLRTVVNDLDVVFSARFARYGAVTAMLAASPGTVLHTFTTFLTPEQLEEMHKSELPRPDDHTGYAYGRLRGLTAMIEGVGVRRDVFVYQSEAPALLIEGEMCAFAEVAAKDRKLAARRHGEVLERAVQLVAPGQDTDPFLLALLADPQRRRRLSGELAAHGRAVELANFRREKIKPSRTRARSR